MIEWVKANRYRPYAPDQEFAVAARVGTDGHLVFVIVQFVATLPAPTSGRAATHDRWRRYGTGRRCAGAPGPGSSIGSSSASSRATWRARWRTKSTPYAAEKYSSSAAPYQNVTA